MSGPEFIGVTRDQMQPEPVMELIIEGSTM